VAALDLLRHLGMTDRGIEMEIHKKMPFGSGLGSSAASAVAGAYAVNKLIGEPLSKQQLLPFAMAGEASADGAWHADNVAPCLLGGIVFIRSNDELDVAQLPAPKNLWAAVVHPDIEILTKVAREILPTEIPLENATQQIGNLGGLLCGIIQEDYGLISRSIHDVIAEPRRQKLIPDFYKPNAPPWPPVPSVSRSPAPAPRFSRSALRRRGNRPQGRRRHRARSSPPSRSATRPTFRASTRSGRACDRKAKFDFLLSSRAAHRHV
jgi:hypothetical protein